MANIYIVCSKTRENYKSAFIQTLRKYGHNITDNNIRVGLSIEDEIKKTILITDVYLAIISNDLFRDATTFNEFLAIKNHTEKNKQKLFIPIFLAGINFDAIPYSVSKIAGIKLEDDRTESIENASRQINKSINDYLNDRILEDEKEKIQKDRIEKSHMNIFRIL